jgi:hypothetical protein
MNQKMKILVMGGSGLIAGSLQALAHDLARRVSRNASKSNQQ